MRNKDFLLFFGFIGLILLQVISGFFPDNFFWGIDYWRYLPYGFFFIILFIIFCTVIFWFSGEWLDVFRDSIKNFILTKPRILIALIFAIFSAVFFYLFRVKLFLLGDGYLHIRNITIGIYLIVAEPLDILLHSLVYKLLFPIASIDAAQTYVFVSIACGIIFIFFSAYLIEYLGDTFHQRWITFFALCTSATMLLFFGYVESYTIVTVLLAGFFIGGLRSIKKNISPLIPSFLLGLSISTHTSAVILIPALFCLWIRYFHILPTVKRRVLSGFVGVGLFVFPILITVIIFIVKKIPSAKFINQFLKGRNILPFSSLDKTIDTAYSMFSFFHFLDMFNELFLVAPLFFIGMVIIYRYRKKLLVHPDHRWLFLAIASMMYIICLSVFNLKIGASQDWDLFSPMAIPLTLFTMRSIFLVVPRLNRRELSLLAIFLLLHIIPWLLVNANSNWSLKRFMVMTRDTKWSVYAKSNAFDELRAYYTNKGQDDIALIYARRAVLNEGNARYFYNLAVTAHRLNRFSEAVNNYQKTLNMDPNYYDAYINYIEILFKSGQFKGALAVCESAKQRFETPMLYYNTAAVLSKLNYLDEAGINYQKTLDLDPNYYDAYFNYSNILIKRGQFKEALAVCELAKQRFETPKLYYNTAIALATLKRQTEAIQNLRIALELKPDFPEALSLLNQLTIVQK
ncbi:tetratricopeptide repeat protein [candidate division KSB1 bacterium]